MPHVGVALPLSQSRLIFLGSEDDPPPPDPCPDPASGPKARQTACARLE